jgi:predicted nucleotidyltransferase
MPNIPLPSEEDRAALELAVSILKRHGAEAVYLFGSMASGSARPDSDWDIGVEGLPSSAFFPALGDLLDHMNRKVDLVELDDGSRFAGFLKEWEELIRVA